jgi:hypothetical protein
MKSPPPKRKKSTSAQSTGDISSANSNKETFDPEHPSTATITVTAVEVPELTEDEQRDRLFLERKVERAFFEAGKALAELRDCLRHWRSQSQTVPLNSQNL